MAQQGGFLKRYALPIGIVLMYLFTRITSYNVCYTKLLRIEPGGQARQLAVALIGVCGHVDRGSERLCEALEAAVVAPGLGRAGRADFDTARRGAQGY